MKKHFITWSAILFACYSMNVAAGSSHPAGSDGKGLSLRLELPWTTLMTGEDIQYNIILENAANQPTSLAFPYKVDGFGWIEGGQIFLEAFPPLVEPELDIHKAQWPPKTMLGEEMEAWGELPAGRRVVWNHNRVPRFSFGVISSGKLKSIQAHWLVGPEKWISSELVAVKMVDIPLSQRREVFTTSWSDDGSDKNNRQGCAYVTQIEGQHFLFYNDCRIAKVELGDEFSHQIDEHVTNLEIVITSNETSRKVYFHLRHGLIQDKPWAIGPTKLIHPKPEPIPPKRLAELRKEMGIED